LGPFWVRPGVVQAPGVQPLHHGVQCWRGCRLCVRLLRSATGKATHLVCRRRGATLPRADALPARACQCLSPRIAGGGEGGDGALDMAHVASAMAELNFNLSAPGDQERLRALLAQAQAAGAGPPSGGAHRSAPAPARAAPLAAPAPQYFSAPPGPVGSGAGTPPAFMLSPERPAEAGRGGGALRPFAPRAGAMAAQYQHVRGPRRRWACAAPARAAPARPSCAARSARPARRRRRRAPRACRRSAW